MKAYIFLTLKAGSKIDLSKRPFNDKNIIDKLEIYGKYDVVLKFKFNKFQELRKFIKRLRSLENVVDTTTMIAEK